MTEKRDIEKTWKHDDRDIVTKMKSLGGMKAAKRAKYVAKKKALVKIVDDIKKWQARYDPSVSLSNLEFIISRRPSSIMGPPI